jgi:phage shock protein C
MKRLYRSDKDKVIAGVCGGIAEYFKIDPVIPRIIFLVSILPGGISILAYFIFWIAMPEAPTNTKVNKG